jgi:arabinogalactan oligomer / maltooligosaccharide transport system permease protein
MKIFSIIKAIASGLVWGLGQILNLQFAKAFFFFLFFSAIVLLELGTSNYFVDTDAMNKVIGRDFGDDYVQLGFLADYNYDKLVSGSGYATFEEYLDEIGGEENLTEELLIKFLAQDLRENNPIVYKRTIDSTIFNPEDEIILDQEKVHLFRRQNLFIDSEGTYYSEIDVKLPSGDSEKQYVETTILTNELNFDNVLLTNEGLETFNKSGDIFRYQGILYVRVSHQGITKYLNLLTEEVVTISQPAIPTRVNLLGPLYRINGVIYEYIEPGLIYNSVRLQYKETPFTKIFRQSMTYTFSQPGNQYDQRDYTRLMLKIYLEINQDLKEQFLSDYNDFFYDRAGLIIRGYWGVVTLGTSRKVNFTAYMALEEALVGGPGIQFTIPAEFRPLEQVPIRGHVSTMLLLEGLIGVITSLIFMTFMIWSISDAYKTSELKRKKQKVLKQGAYFKSVYEDYFEYIILFIPIVVLAFISIMPIAFGFIIAFTSIEGNESMLETFDWVGLTNFLALFDFTSGLGASYGIAFWRVLSWTIVWAILSTFTVFFGGFIQALILNSEKVVFRKLWRTILILPWAIPALLSQMVFAVMFNDFGLINSFLQDIGIYQILRDAGMLGVDFNTLTGFARYLYLGRDNIQWFTNGFNPTFVRATLVFVNIWLGFPYFMALMTGVMTAIDATLYEAADIDGASKFQKISKITMPLVLYSTAPILIMTFSGNFNNFGVIYFITGGGPNTNLASRGYAGDTDILISWMYKLTVEYSIYNMASVFSVLIFLFVGSITAWNLSRTRAFQED